MRYSENWELLVDHHLVMTQIISGDSQQEIQEKVSMMTDVNKYPPHVKNVFARKVGQTIDHGRKPLKIKLNF